MRLNHISSMVIQIVIFINNAYYVKHDYKLWSVRHCISLREMRVTYTDVCLKNILSRAELRCAYQIPHADISITPVIRLGSDSDILLLFVSYGASSATDIYAALLS